jgi:hypothetical protein
MKRAGLFTYPWDYADEGVDALVDRICDLGITRVLVASVYHAGYFLHPHNPRRKTHLLEDGVAYFHPRDEFYADSPIKPQVAAMAAEQDWFGVISERAGRAGLAVSAWNVCLHNTRLGLLHPEATIHNVYGDSYPHALSPAHPAARKYVRSVVADISRNYPLTSVLLEAPNYRKRAHGGTWVSGHHHEREGVYLRPLEQALLDISFNEADVEQASGAGVDVESLREAVRDHLDRYFDEAPAVPANLPETIDQFHDAVPALAEYEAHFARAEESLLAELLTVVQANGVKLEAGVSPSTDWVVSGGYGLTPAEMADMIATLRQEMLPHQELGYGVRMGFNNPDYGYAMTSEEATCGVASTVAESGVDEILFYNYGEAPRRSVEWIKPALRQIMP